MAENKTKPTTASVDAFIANVENSRRRSDAHIRFQEFHGGLLLHFGDFLPHARNSSFAVRNPMKQGPIDDRHE